MRASLWFLLDESGCNEMYIVANLLNLIFKECLAQGKKFLSVSEVVYGGIRCSYLVTPHGYHLTDNSRLIFGL